MSKLKIILLISIIYIYGCADKKEEKLKGTVISSEEEESKTLENAFSDDYTEEFKSSKLSNGWVGLKLKSQSRITKIGWAQKKNEKENYLLGIFEGANEPTFIDAFPLYMITEEGKAGKMNYVTIEVNYSFKYVRYIGPHNKTCIISGLEFYGYEEEKKIEKDEESLYQPTNLPLVVIHTENLKEVINKEVDLPCEVVIIDKNKRDTKASGVINLRGNSSSRHPKIPYKIQFESKQRLLDFESKAKKWNLLANYNDKSLIRNALAFKLSSLFDMKYTPNCKFVDLMVNGEFRGNYNLCDKVEVRKGRMELDEMDENSNEEPEITGGYLIEATGYAKQDEIYGESKKGILYSIRYPKRSDITPEQLDYLDKFFNGIEEDAYSGIADKIDHRSFSDYMIVQELAANADSIWSIYMFKEREDDKLYFGPLWDFDLSFGNDRRSLPLSSKTNFIFKYNSLSAGTMKEFIVKLLSNKKLLQSVKDRWKEVMDLDIKKIMFKFIDEQVKFLEESIKLNFIRWDILRRKVGIVKCTYEGEIEYLKEFITERMNQLDGMINNATVEFVNEEIKMGGWGGWGGNGQNQTNRTFPWGNPNTTGWGNWGNPNMTNQTHPGWPNMPAGNNRTFPGMGGFDWGNVFGGNITGEERLPEIDQSCLESNDD